MWLVEDYTGQYNARYSKREQPDNDYHGARDDGTWNTRQTDVALTPFVEMLSKTHKPSNNTTRHSATYWLTNAKAAKALNAFFTEFLAETHAANFESTWRFLCSTIHDELYTLWYKDLHEIATLEVIETKMECCSDKLMI